MIAEPDRPSNAAPGETQPRAAEPVDQRNILRFGKGNGLPGLAALVIVEPNRAATTLEAIFGTDGPPSTLAFEGTSGRVLVYQGPWPDLTMNASTIEGTLPLDPGDDRLSGIQVLLGSRQEYPSVPVEPPGLLARAGWPGGSTPTTTRTSTASRRIS